MKERNPSTPSEDEKWEQALSWNIFMVEKECSQRIDADYPLMKFFSLMENLHQHVQNEKKEYERMRKK